MTFQEWWQHIESIDLDSNSVLEPKELARLAWNTAYIEGQEDEYYKLLHAGKIIA